MSKYVDEIMDIVDKTYDNYPEIFREESKRKVRQQIRQAQRDVLIECYQYKNGDVKHPEEISLSVMGKINQLKEEKG